jgi:hypothetical protein
MKDGLTVIGWIGAFLVLIALTVAGTWAFRWYTADFKGQLTAREEILSGANRITAYNHFFNLCASVQASEGGLDALTTELTAYTPGTSDYSRTLTNITGVRANRARSIAQYNADAAKDYTTGQFRDLDLPYELGTAQYVPEKGSKTRCAA